MLNRLFSRKPKTAAAPDGCRAYAIGDVHGCIDLMKTLLARIEADDRKLAPAQTYLVFLGDLVDRGPHSREVIEYLVHTPPSFARSVVIKGNHEEYFLSVLKGEREKVLPWLSYGGYETAESYGISKGWTLNASPDELIERLAREVPQAHRQFLEGMADSFRFGDYLFVHAGIRPGLELEEQSSQDLRWIRDGFLEDQRDHGMIVIHGHTIVNEPQQHANRIALDTGAYKTGVLTALGIEGQERWFLDARTEPVA